MELMGPFKYMYVLGDHVNYRCKPGFLSRPVFITLSVCGPSGKWTPVSMDACYKKSCDLQVDPVNGQVILLNKSYEFGTQIQFSCNDGFYLTGNEILHCLLNGSDVKWSGRAPVCEKVLCQPPPNIPNGGYSRHKDVFEYLEVVTYACHRSPGEEELSLVGDRRLYCLGKDLWSSPPPECKVVSCPHPVVPNGRQTAGFRVKHHYKARVKFECHQGFFLHGSDTVVCAADGTWQPPVPHCEDTPPPATSKVLHASRRSPNSTNSRSNQETSRSQRAKGWVPALSVVYVIGIMILCTCLYRFIRSKK